MSVYPPPIQNVPIFNSQEFSYASSGLTVSTADSRYLKLTGGIESGLVTFNAGLNSVGKLSVTGSGAASTLSNLKLNSYDTVNSYIQNNIQNLSSGASASSDWIATNDNGSDSKGYVDLGINSSTNNSTIGQGSDAYLFTVSDLSNNGGNLYVGTQSPKSLYLFANTNTPSAANSITYDGSLLNVPSITAFKTTGGISGNEAIRILSYNAPYMTRLYSVNSAFNSDLYLPIFNGIDSLVSTSSSDNLQNKTMVTLKVGANGSTFSQISAGSFTLTNPNLTPAGATTQVITHNLGSVPSGMVACIAMVGGPGTALNFLLCTVTNMTSTQATINIVNVHISATTVGSPTISWKAWL